GEGRRRVGQWVGEDGGEGGGAEEGRNDADAFGSVRRRRYLGQRSSSQISVPGRVQVGEELLQLRVGLERAGLCQILHRGDRPDALATRQLLDRDLLLRPCRSMLSRGRHRFSSSLDS